VARREIEVAIRRFSAAASNDAKSQRSWSYAITGVRSATSNTVARPPPPSNVIAILVPSRDRHQLRSRYSMFP
jgi:hypothetical protein